METFNIYKWIESTKQLLAEKDWEAVSKEKSKLKRCLKEYSEVGSKAIYNVKHDSILYRGRIYKEEDRFRRWADYDSSEGQQFRGYGEAESFINLDVNVSIFPLIGNDIIILASGSNPIFIASVAFVFFFSL